MTNERRLALCNVGGAGVACAGRHQREQPSTDPDHRTSCSSMLACHGFHDPVSQPFAARYNAKVLHRFKSSPAHLGRKVGPNGERPKRDRVWVDRQSDVGDLAPRCRLARLWLFIDWACRQLQHRGPLPGREVGDKHDCAV